MTDSLQCALRAQEDSWQFCRDLSHFEEIIRDYSFGRRRTLQVLPEFVDQYELLQTSRGVDLTVGDTIPTLAGRIYSTLIMTPLDLLRESELISLLPRGGLAGKGFMELGFRDIRILRRYRDVYGAIPKGFDISCLSVDLAKFMGFDVERIDFNDPSVMGKKFDASVIVSYHMLEHVSDPLRAIRSIYEGMTPGSVFHVEVPVEIDGPRIRFGHMFPFHPNDLGNMLSEAGFKIAYGTRTVGSDDPDIDLSKVAVIERHLAFKE